MAGGIFAIVFSIIYLGFIVFSIMTFWKTYTKAGQPGWACLIPIYNFLIMADIAKVSRSKAILGMVVGFVGYALYMYMMLANQGDMEAVYIGLAVMMITAIAVLIITYPIYKGIAVNFGKSPSFAFGLMFLNLIFFAILAFGDARYQDNEFKSDDVLDSNF